jgi:hypothetical protein
MRKVCAAAAPALKVNPNKQVAISVRQLIISHLPRSFA